MMRTWLARLPRLLPGTSWPAQLLPRVWEEGPKRRVAPNLNKQFIHEMALLDEIPEGLHPYVGASTSEAIGEEVDIPTGRGREIRDLPGENN